MSDKINLDGKEYDVENFNETEKATFDSLKFVSIKIDQLVNMQALLKRAKQSYIEDLKQEVLSSKAGLLLGED